MGALNDKVKKIRSDISEIQREFQKRISDPNRYLGEPDCVRVHHIEFDKIAIQSLRDANNALLNFLGAVDE